MRCYLFEEVFGDGCNGLQFDYKLTCLVLVMSDLADDSVIALARHHVMLIIADIRGAAL